MPLIVKKNNIFVLSCNTMKNINNEKELRTFLSTDGCLNVIKFSAEWCGPCKMLSKVITDIEGERSDVRFCEVDVDTYPDSLESFGIKSIPVMFYYMDGMIVDKTIGAMTKPKLMSKIDENLKK